MKCIKKITNIILIILCLSLFSESVSINAKQSANKIVLLAKAKKKVTKKPKSSKNKKKSSKSKAKPAIPNSHIFLKDTLLGNGISYKKIYATINRMKHCVHILQVDLNNKKSKVSVLKGGNNITELERLPEMLIDKNLEDTTEVAVGAVNANFWRAGTNYPMGPAVINGEIAEMKAYKLWNSTFFNEQGKPFTGFFSIQGEVITKSGRLKINSVNRRADSTGIVIYNKYGGDIIPYINSKKVQQLMLESVENIFVDGELVDSTESVEQAISQKDELLAEERASNLEYNLKKLVVQYISTPAINTFIDCKVIDIVSGSVQMQPNTFIISIGTDINTTLLPKIGDNINIHYWTNNSESEVFTDAVSGVPRLVRDGIARHEAVEEGIKSRRFINGMLPRTAIGYDKNKTKLFLVAVTGTKKADGVVGASLSQLADIMEYIGCYTAQNLDGGGSTNMVVGNQNVINFPSSRKLSVGIAVSKTKNEKIIDKLPRKSLNK